VQKTLLIGSGNEEKADLLLYPGYLVNAFKILSPYKYYILLPLLNVGILPPLYGGYKKYKK